MLNINSALIVYGTRYGAAASTSQEIAQMLRQEGLEVKVANAKGEKIKSIGEYDLVIVGSGIQINRWTSEPEGFLKRFRKDLGKKKLALFVCCGSASSNDATKIAEAKSKYLEEKATKFGLHPAALGLFGGVYNYNNEPWWAKRALEMDRPRVQATYKETAPGIYDTRDWDSIRLWAKGLVE